MLTKRITARWVEKEKPKRMCPNQSFFGLSEHNGELTISKLVLIRPKPEDVLSMYTARTPPLGSVVLVRHAAQINRRRGNSSGEIWHYVEFAPRIRAAACRNLIWRKPHPPRAALRARLTPT